VPKPDHGKVLGSLLGLGVCEALAASAAPLPAAADPLPGGAWGDGTSMALTLAESLAECGGVDQRDQMIRYTSWFRYGHMSSGETCDYIDEAVKQATLRFERTWDPEEREGAQGDVCLARVAPVAAYFSGSGDVLEACAMTTRTTHSGTQTVDACLLLAAMIRESFGTANKTAVLNPALADGLCEDVAALFLGGPSAHPACTALGAAMNAFREASTFAQGCALCREHGSRALAAYGQLAGAWYGAEGIPAAWRASIAKPELFEKMTGLLLGT